MIEVSQGTSGGEPAEADRAILSPDEQARCDRFVRAQDRAWFAAAHAEMRRIISKHLDVAPEELRFGRAPCPRCEDPGHGRPIVEYPENSISFSLSHSGQHWALAIADTPTVGVDIEKLRKIDIVGLSHTVLSKGERDHLDDLDPEAAIAAFYRCWTRKEAVLKGVGVGIATNLREVDAQPAVDGQLTIRHEDSWWDVRDLPTAEGLAGAVALPAVPEAR